jgi:hypothetical protein
MMANSNSSDLPEVRTETIGLQTLSAAEGVTIKNDTRSDALVYMNNVVWRSVSLGYIRAGKSGTLPTIVNVDAYALFVSADAAVFIDWPGPKIHYNKKKVNLTPGQTYSLSNFS